jgi:hypothetical protein
MTNGKIITMMIFGYGPERMKLAKAKTGNSQISSLCTIRGFWLNMEFNVNGNIERAAIKKSCKEYGKKALAAKRPV